MLIAIELEFQHREHWLRREDANRGTEEMTFPVLAFRHHESGRSPFKRYNRLMNRRPQVSVLGSAEPGSDAYEMAAEAGALLARLGITLVSGCGSPATRVAAERALQAGGLVVSIIPPDEMPSAEWPATVVIPCGMGDARNLLMALAGDACIVIGGRAGTISEVCLAWLHKRPLLPLLGCGGWSDSLPANPPDERKNSQVLGWNSPSELEARLKELGLVAR